MPQLTFLTGPLAGKKAVLKGRQVSLGRDAGNSIRLDDESIAPRHIVLVREDDGYSIYIDSSKPPVAINGKQIINEILKNGDLIQLGTVRARYTHTSKAKGNSLDFTANLTSPLQKKKPAPEILSLDDAEPLPLEDAEPRGRFRWLLLPTVIAILMIGGILILLRVQKPPAETTVAETKPEPPMLLPKELPPVEIVVPKEEPPLGPLPVGVGESGLRDGATVHRTKNYKSHQEAVDACKPGDAVIFDSPDPRPIVLIKPLRDVQFLSGQATWEVHADLIDCQFLYHETRQFVQRGGKLERCVFFRCPMKQTLLLHADAVSFYFDERSPLHPKDNPDAGRTPALQLTGFVRDVLIHKPIVGSLLPADKRFDMRWGPVVRIHATDAEGDGRGTYILSPIVLGQRAWTPFEITRGNGITFAHLTTDGNAWADPVLDIVRGSDCVLLSNSFGSEIAVTAEQYLQPPKKLRYHDHEEFGHDNGPAYRGPVMTVAGQRTRIVAQGDARKPWSMGRKMALPGLHYADGVVAADPFIRQFVTEQGGIDTNFTESMAAFVQLPTREGATFLSQPQQLSGEPMYPRDGPELHRPVFVPLKDLRLSPGEFDKLPLIDMTGKTAAEIEKELAADRSIFLGPGTYELKQAVRSGFIAGAGMGKTILKWPETVDCAQRNCRGMINCTVSGGRYGYNSQAGVGGRVNNPGGLFLRTRFTGQQEAAVNLHCSIFQTWQDCEFASCKLGFTHGQDSAAGTFKGDKGATGGTTIDNLNLCNCTFRDIKLRAIDLKPDAPNLGHVGIHHCAFERIGDSAVRIDGGQTHLMQSCKFLACAGQNYNPAISIVSNGTVAVSHVDVDCSGVKGNPVCVSLKGLCAVSRSNFRGMPTSLKCEGLLAGDFVVADGAVKANKDSILCRCRFKNMDLPDGTVIVTEGDFVDVTALTVPAVIDRTPPPAVQGLKVRTVMGLKQLDWDPAVDAESGIMGYQILSDGREVARVGFSYEPPSDYFSPLYKIPVPTTFTDPDPLHRKFEVLPINGAGLLPTGKLIAPRRPGPARATFRTKEANPIEIKDFINVKGRVTQIVDMANTRLPLEAVGLKGRPNLVTFEQGPVIEVP